jgi:hypothetical protein
MSDTEMMPWEMVADPSYFRKVMGNMVALGFGPKSPDPAYVRFGLTGIGHAPNYQVEGPDGTIHCFRGMGHGEATDAGDEFAAANLSTERFNYIDVQAMLARLASEGR